MNRSFLLLVLLLSFLCMPVAQTVASQAPLPYVSSTSQQVLQKKSFVAQRKQPAGNELWRIFLILILGLVFPPLLCLLGILIVYGFNNKDEGWSPWSVICATLFVLSTLAVLTGVVYLFISFPVAVLLYVCALLAGAACTIIGFAISRVKHHKKK